MHRSLGKILVIKFDRLLTIKYHKSMIKEVSGGADSVCLLNVLYEIRKKYNLTLYVVHVNHGIRGTEALRDEQFVENMAKSMDVYYESRHVDVPNIAKKLNALGGNITIYDHTKKHLDQAMTFGYDAIPYEEIVKLVEKFDIIINTVPSQELKQVHYEKIRKDCVLFEIASSPYGLSKSIADKYHLSLFTCPGIPGKYSPKNAGELIAKSIISYLERTGENGTQL